MRIMIVDDEPFYTDHLKEVIENSSFSTAEQAQIVAQCISASQALELIPTVQPHLIFTDIKMQLMNGIELATTIRQQWPHIIVVIVSGYSSFEYARDAIRAYVNDYLVKPVDPSSIEQILDKTNKRIIRETDLQQQQMLKALLDNEPLGLNSLAFLKHCFAFPSFAILLFHKKTTSTREESIFPSSEVIYQSLSQSQLLLHIEKAWILPKVDHKSGFVILGLHECDYPRLKAIATHLLQIMNGEEYILSMAVSPIFNKIIHLHQLANQLRDQLYQQLVIGYSKEIYLFEKITTHETSNLLLDSSDEKKLAIIVDKRDWKQLRRVITQWFSQWEKNSCPNLFMQKNVNRILQWLEKYFRSLDPLTSVATEKALEELIESAYSFQQAETEIWNLLSNTFQMEDQNSNNDKGIQLIELITEYLGANLSEALTMTQVIERFQISSTHLGNLFRRYIGKTFVEYLTTLRIDKAKELIRMDPDMPLKDIAEIVGYTDRHYFTKVFKLVTGIPPTEFKDQLHRSQE